MRADEWVDRRRIGALLVICCLAEARLSVIGEFPVMTHSEAGDPLLCRVGQCGIRRLLSANSVLPLSFGTARL